MAVFYLDTSALVKRYRTELGTEVVEDLLSNPSQQDRFFTSFLSIIELTSGILRLAKGRQLREETAQEILARFRADVHELLRVWPLDEDGAAAAVTVVQQHRLRSADAIHLATAEAIGSLVPDARVVMVSSDRELLDAAEAAGLTPLDPQASDAGERLRQVRR
jgi:predicted nucleic acid-binding protein